MRNVAAFSIVALLLTGACATRGDYNGDGWPDLFVANDKVPSKLYRNTGHGAFVEEGMDRGIAVDENGSARAAMGVDAADYDRSGRPHVVVGNFRYEMLGL